MVVGVRVGDGLISLQSSASGLDHAAAGWLSVHANGGLLLSILGALWRKTDARGSAEASDRQRAAAIASR